MMGLEENDMAEPLKRYGGFLHPTHACYDGKTEYCKSEDVADLEARVRELEAQLADSQGWVAHHCARADVAEELVQELEGELMDKAD